MINKNNLFKKVFLLKCYIIIFVCAWNLCPAGTADEPPKATTAKSKYKETLDYVVSQFFDRKPAGPSPGTIAGDIKYNYNRTSSGWSVYLFNDKPAKIRSKPVVVTVDLRKLRPNRIKDMLSGEVFDDDLFKIPVAPGQYRILQILAGQFEPEYYWEYSEAGNYKAPPKKRFLCEWF